MKLKNVINTNVLITKAVGIIYLWFGGLKFFPGMSPAEDLAGRTIIFLTSGLLTVSAGVLTLAVIEVLIGFFLLSGVLSRLGIWIAIIHLVLTFTPMISEPETVWDRPPFDLTLVGQYIIKNIVILSALLAVLPSSKRRKAFGRRR